MQIQKKLNKSAFTLTELIVVIILLGIVAGYVIPNSVERTRVRDAMTQLRTLHAANQIVRAQTDAFVDAACLDDIVCINDAFGIGLTSSRLKYSYRSPRPDKFTAVARREDPVYFVTVTEAPLEEGINPVCRPAVSPYCPR
jgi:prepilin-type N-terminal cleavage/methylation domain-containing protein